jgi:hypothetical protein
VEVVLTMSFNHVPIIHGIYSRNHKHFFIANVYAPCDVGGKEALWNQLSAIISNNLRNNWCVCGNFNVIHSDEERNIRGETARHEDFTHFNRSIEGTMLADLPLYG